jgi:hypothetical protein
MSVMDIPLESRYHRLGDFFSDRDIGDRVKENLVFVNGVPRNLSSPELYDMVITVRS